MDGSRERARDWAVRTWRSFVAATYDETAWPADSLATDLDPATRTRHTSPTNIGGLLWSAVAAHRLGLCPADEATARCARALETLAAAPIHAATGLPYNWYDAATGVPIDTWGPRRRPLAPFVSSVDAAWLAVGLRLVAATMPSLRGPARALADRMRFDAFYDPGARPQGGLLRGGFWERPQGRRSTPTPCLDSPPVHATRHHYALLNSETRLCTYVGMLAGQVPPAAYDALEAPVRRYRGRELVASLGGSMFEALAVDMFVPEEVWAPATWGANHAATVASQREFALVEQGWPAWGSSPCACPGRGYAEFGVPPLGIRAQGYRTHWRGQGVVTAHASVMALQYDVPAALDNLDVLAGSLGCLGPGGFVDAVGVRTGLTARRHLLLDQAFVMAALANHLADDVMRGLFCPPEVTAVLRPAVAGRGWPIER